MELELPEDINIKPVEIEIELTKPRKKKVYTAPKTDKQLENFDKAKQIRLEIINKKKLEDQEKLIKQILDNEKKIKESQKQTKVLMPEPEQDSSSSDSDSDDDEIIIKSKPKSKPKPKKPKKKTVVYLSESESDEEPEPEPIQKSRVQRKTSNYSEPKKVIEKIEYKNYFI